MKRTTAVGHSYTAEELDMLFRSGTLERIGMGSRRACYVLPGMKLCVKCYRSDEEIEEGKIQGRHVIPLPDAVVREIDSCRFDERRNTSCQEYRYWKDLRRKLPCEMFSVFPMTMECVLVPSRGWCLVEELIENEDGSMPQSVHKILLGRPSLFQKEVESAFRVLMDGFSRYRVKLYDPSNFLVQKTFHGFRLRLADFEPAVRTLIPLDDFLPFLTSFKVRRRANRFLNFVRQFRTRDISGFTGCDLYVVRNHAGRVLVAWTDRFVEADPDLAAKVIPIPLAEANMYKESSGSRLWKQLSVLAADNECAWMFYPSKRDDVRTVFFWEEGRLYVRKIVNKRALRILPQKFIQRDVPPLPIFEGTNQFEYFRELMITKDYETVARAFIGYFEGLMDVFPPVSDGILPPCTFDAIPQNCIVSKDGKMNFFDLEYDMVGGVPLSYLIFRSVTSTLFKIFRTEHVEVFDFRKCIIGRIANYFGVVVDEEECIKINAAVKQFNSRGFGRILTNIWLSLIPVRSWRIRFCWWSMLPAGSKFHDARTGETAAVVCKEPATPAHGKKKGV